MSAVAGKAVEKGSELALTKVQASKRHSEGENCFSFHEESICRCRRCGEC